MSGAEFIVEWPTAAELPIFLGFQIFLGFHIFRLQFLFLNDFSLHSSMDILTI